MAEYKNQHYVPVLLLKNFSNDGKTINLCVVNKEKYINSASIKDQSSEDNFYGKDKEIEKNLSQLERIFSILLGKILNDNFIPSRGSFEHFLLDLLILSTSARTRYSGEAINEQLDKINSIVFSHDKRYKEFAKKFKVGIENPASFSLGIAVQNVKYVADLEFKILDNQTPTNFIISDNPVVKHNTFLRQRKVIGSHVGFATRGIQFILPLNLTKCVVLYDQNCYKIGNRKDRIVTITDKNDILALNELQLLNSNEVIYFSQKTSRAYISSIILNNKCRRNTEKVNVKEFTKEGSTIEKGSSLIMSSASNIDYDIKISVIKNTKKSSKIVLDNRVVQFRSKKLENMLKEDRKNDSRD